MAVPEHLRSESKLEVLTKSRELALYTSTICSNEKVFPKRDRWLLTNKIVEASLSIMEDIATANSIFVASKRDYELRREYQTRAFAYTARLLSLMDLAKEKYNLADNRVKHWTQLVVDTRNLVRKWKKSDSDRYKKYR